VGANFGYTPYGKTILGTVIYPDPHEGCEPFNMTDYLTEDNIMILIDRGTCTFATKSYYGELAGASLVIIVDYEGDNVENIILADDENGKIQIFYYKFEGLGDLVGIPVVMISHFDGENIKNAVFGESTDNTTNPQD